MIRMRDKNKIGMSENGDLLISCKVFDEGGPVGTGMGWLRRGVKMIPTPDFGSLLGKTRVGMGVGVGSK